MASLFDTSYGDTQRGIGWYPRREPARPSPSLWDYIEAAAMTPVPGVADVASGALAARDFGAGRWGQGLLNAAGALPFVPALGQIFIGVKGANKAQKQALVTAQRMAKEGAGRDEIWNATMWYRGKDGKWRTEISDEAAKFTGMPTVRNAQGYLEVSKSPTDFLQHDELFAAYPELKNLSIKAYPITGENGSYDAARKLIEINVPNEQQGKSILLHEFQHPIQEAEGMARGGSPEAMSLLDIAPQSLVDSIKRSHAYRLQVAQGRNANDALEGMLAPYMSSTGNAAEAKIEAYKRLLGEVDARNTQKRMDMTLDQRREFPPWSTWDVPEADQIVRMEGGPAMLRGLLGR